MRSRDQELKMLKNTALILSLLPFTSSIGEISERTDIKSSTIQRYLNNEDLIKRVLEITKSSESYEDISVRIKEWLSNSKKNGNQRGGLKSQSLYSFSKDNEGRFLGSGKLR